MANTSRPQGARCKGAPLRANVYQSGGAVYPGDFVSHNSAGQVVAASATTALLGVAIGYASASGKDILVADDPDQLFIVNSSGTAPSAQTDLMLNYDIVATAGSATYKISQMTLNAATGATTATLPLRLLDIEKRPDDALGANADCIVVINNHQLKGGTGTVGT